MKADIKIIVAAHKEYWMPEDEIYLPLHVGAALGSAEDGGPLDMGFARDDTGDNISSKNREYCELTGLYWAWKNLDADYVGLVHYRRHFTRRRTTFFRDKRTMPVTYDDVWPILEKHDVIVPEKRRYVIETNKSHYAHAHYEGDLMLAREVICDICPEYADSFDKVMRRTGGHRFNMLIMSRDVLNAYCSWLFAILSELENRIDLTGYSMYDRRVFGFIGERLLDVWLEERKQDYAELPHVFMEKQNWIIKGLGFMKRKISPNNK